MTSFRTEKPFGDTPLLPTLLPKRDLSTKRLPLELREIMANVGYHTNPCILPLILNISPIETFAYREGYRDVRRFIEQTMFLETKDHCNLLYPLGNQRNYFVTIEFDLTKGYEFIKFSFYSYRETDQPLLTFDSRNNQSRDVLKMLSPVFLVPYFTNEGEELVYASRSTSQFFNRVLKILDLPV